MRHLLLPLLLLASCRNSEPCEDHLGSKQADVLVSSIHDCSIKRAWKLKATGADTTHVAVEAVTECEDAMGHNPRVATICGGEELLNLQASHALMDEVIIDVENRRAREDIARLHSLSRP
jgi:hypothetical protein